MTIRLVKKFRRESHIATTEEASLAFCKKTIQSWVDEFKNSKKTDPALIELTKLGAAQNQPSSNYRSDEL